MINKKKKLKKLLEKIMFRIEKNKEIKQKTKERIKKISTELNKERLLENFINKVNIYYSYEPRDRESFPIDSWVDSFFENS